MTNYEIHNVEAAPELPAVILDGVKDKIGFIPNVFAVIAESPAALAGFLGLNEAFAAFSFTGGEQLVIQLAAIIVWPVIRLLQIR
jgi:hypothetical protein